MNNRRYPPEWEKQRTTWLSWPHNEKEWGRKRLPEIKRFFQELISQILKLQDVNLLLTNEEMLEEVERFFPVQKSKFKLKKIIVPNNDIWIRDYGPFFLETASSKKKKSLLLDFEFNAWGGKFSPWELDNQAPKEIALYLGQEIESYPIVLEGGSIEFSGNGLILTTEQCLLNKNRNPNLSKDKIENILKSAFNIEEVIWLKRGLEGDHTDGHIDDVARFIDPRKVLICKSNDKKDGNYDHLNQSIEYLKKWKHKEKRYKLEVIELPMPERMEIKKERLPKSYANFIFVNGGVIVPVFNCNTDKEALAIFKKVFPDKKIVGIDCSLLIQEGGGLHCMTKQEPVI
ncbi:MAG: agmatine deiminase family protein [Candidatus Melainabacteria bacterium]|nr:agmatine deiminase family protein [Candidatus Melainabacteria bacterium]